MYNLKDVNERTTATLTIDFLDEAGDPVVPEALSYRIDDVASGTEILATTLFAGSLLESIDIIITSAQNRILSAIHSFEMRRVTVDFTYNTDRHGTDHYTYRIINLPGIPLS